MSSANMTRNIFITILITCFTFVSCVEEDWYLGFADRVSKYGYNVSDYNITTADGYILTLFRVSHPDCIQIRPRPVYMQHGTIANPISFLDAGANASTLLSLARNCYDVWAGTNRGTYYGRNHVSLNPDEDSEFWEYDLHEMAVYDLPAQIDFVLNITEADNVDFIGYSQGGGIALALLSENANYTMKFNKFIGLAPSSRLTNTKSLLLKSVLTAIATVGEYVLDTGEVFRRQSLTLGNLCKYDEFELVCREFIYSLDTYVPGSISDYTAKVVAANLPDGISLKLAKYYYQLLTDDKFKKYDYGDDNLEVYGSETAPIYDLSKIQNEVYFIYGLDDHMVDPEDLEWARMQIPNATSVIVNYTECNHIDLNFSQFTPIYVYPLIIDILSN